MAKVRLTITIDEELLARYQVVADQERRSLSSLVNTWLEQAIEGAEFVGEMAEGQRGAGQKAIQELWGRLTWAQKSVYDDLMTKTKIKAGAGGPGGRRTPAPASAPRSVIRGVNTQKGTRT